MSASSNVLPIIDTSYSMTSSGYVTATKIDSEAFIRCAWPGDRIGVVSYDQYGRITYPTNGSTQLVTVQLDLQQTKDAAAAIEALSFEGGSTNIGDGIVKARSMMDSAPTPKGLVLLSDGYQNYGTNPLNVLPSYPIYSCAMGPYSDTQLMQKIATGTGGKYYYAPDVYDMMMIFNEIRGISQSAQVVTNQQAAIASTGSGSYPVPIASGDGAQFLFVWNDPDVSYTASTPGAGQIRVTLTDPEGTPWPEAPTVIGGCYVIFNVQNPTLGTWKIGGTLGTVSASLPITAAGFEFGDAAEQIRVQWNQNWKPNAPKALDVQLLYGNQALANPQVTVDVLHAAQGPRDVMDEVRNLVAHYKIAIGQVPGDTPPEVAQLIAIRKATGRNLLPVERKTLHGAHAVLDLHGGNTTLRITASGTLPNGRATQRTRVVTLGQ